MDAGGPACEFRDLRTRQDEWVGSSRLQAESPDELAEIYGRLQAADRPVLEEGATTCCYAKSTKSWIGDPAGVAWEAFLTTGESTFYGDSSDKAEAVRIASKPEAGACCGAQMKDVKA